MGVPATAAVRLLAGDKEPARAATTANITLSGLQTIDGIALAAGDRVLVKDQTDATTNGIYVASEGTWLRAPDASSSRLLVAGMQIHIRQGTVNGGNRWELSTHRPDLGEDDIAFARSLASGTQAVVDARADIASMSVSSSVNTIITGGFTTAGDGGADVLIRHGASNPGLADGFQIEDDNGVWWKRAPNRTIHGKQVGIVADGATDDRPAINAALGYIETTLSGGATLILPAGDIVVSGGDITISSSNTELVGYGRATNLQLGATRTLYIDHASVEVNRSAIRNMRISRTGATALTDVNVRFRRTRRCQITDVFFHSWSGDAIVIGDGGAGLGAPSTYALRCSGQGGASARHAVRFAHSVDTGDLLMSQLMFDAGGTALTGDALRFGGAGIGAVDGIMVSDCLFTAFRGGVHMDFPAGAGIANALFSGITFDSGVESGASNADTFNISVSGGTINTLVVAGCKINAYHTTGSEANFRLDVTSGSVAGVLLNGNILSSSRNEAALISQSGGTVSGFNLIGNYFIDGSGSGAGNSSAVTMSGDIDKIMIAGNTVLHGSGNNWEYGFDLSGLTGDLPEIGTNVINNVATGAENLATAHKEFTPVLTCATPGNLSVSYTTQQGKFRKIGRMVFAEISIITSAFTHTTASGNLQITGLPYSGSFFSTAQRTGGVQWSGITKANYTQLVSAVGSDGTITLRASGSGQATAILAITDLPSGGNVELHMNVAYFI